MTKRRLKCPELAGQDGLPKPAVRPECWGDELEDDPILASQGVVLARPPKLQARLPARAGAHPRGAKTGGRSRPHALDKPEVSERPRAQGGAAAWHDVLLRSSGRWEREAQAPAPTCLEGGPGAQRSLQQRLADALIKPPPAPWSPGPGHAELGAPSGQRRDSPSRSRESEPRQAPAAAPAKAAVSAAAPAAARTCPGSEPPKRRKVQQGLQEALAWAAAAAARGKALPEPARPEDGAQGPPPRPEVVPAADIGRLCRSPGAAQPVGVTRLRLTVLATRSTKSSCVQAAEVFLRCGGAELDLTRCSVENPSGRNPQGEGPGMLLSPWGKWLDSDFRKNGRSVLLLTLPQDARVTDIALRTAGDHPGRDPAQLEVEGSCGDGEWLTLHAAACPLPTARRTLSAWMPLRSEGGSRGAEPSRGGATPTHPERAGAANSALAGEPQPATRAVELSPPPPAVGGARPAALRTPQAAQAASPSGSVCSPGLAAARPVATPLRADLSRSGSTRKRLRESPAWAAGAASTPRTLETLADCGSGSQVDVEALVGFVGEPQRRELPLQPGESVLTRVLALEEGTARCTWTLWAGDAARFGEELLGKRVVVRGAHVHLFGQECRLTGCATVDVCG